MQEPIRVLCVFSTLDRGGAESMCMNLYRHMDRTKVQFDFVKHTPLTGAFEEEIVSLGGRIFEAPRYRIYNHMQYLQWWRNHLEQHPEHIIIHGHFFSISAVYFGEAKKAGRITVAHSHIAKASTRIKKLYIKPIENLADYRLACGMDAGKLLYPHKDFTVLNNAVETEKFRYDPEIRREYRAELGLTDQFVVGIVAGISDHKNPRGVIEIFREVHRIRPEAVLLWVGDGPMRAEIEDLVEEHGLKECVHFTGARNDVNRLLQAMDVFILPSFFEGLPVVLIEAQAAGLKCFVSDTVTREADITGRCEYLAIDDYSGWAEKICGSDVTRADTYEDICRAGYDISTTSDWLCRFYQSIVQEKR